MHALACTPLHACPCMLALACMLCMHAYGVCTQAVRSSQAPISCIHPGWELLSGREDVVESWRSIIRGGAPTIRCREPEVFLYGNTATVLCYEEVEGDFLIATNVFVREVAAWKMVHHQAGPTRGKPQDDPANEKKTQVN